jgi:phenylalanyl-tRNA synthetase beta chain
MRPSLLPGLLGAARDLRGATSLRLFEIGRRYLRDAHGAGAERLTLAVVLAGERPRAAGRMARPSL